MTSAPPGPLVAGYDGTGGSRQAVHWAAREAALRDRPLHVVHAFAAPLERIAGIHLPGAALDVDELRARAEHAVQQVVQECAQDWPDLRISSETRTGHPAAVLHEAAGHAEMLVLGPARHGGPARALLGSTAAELLRSVHVPVVIARGTGSAGTDRVLVGVDGSRNSTRAIGFAFDHAARHEAELHAVLAWDELPGDAIPPAGGWRVDWGDVVRACERRLAESLAGWRERFPDVAVHPEVTTTEAPSEILLRLAEDADLAVVGRHGNALLRLAMLGSTSRTIAHYAPCPVAVVR